MTPPTKFRGMKLTVQEPSAFVLHCAALTMAEHLQADQNAHIIWPDGEGEWPDNFMARMGDLCIVVRVESW